MKQTIKRVLAALLAAGLLVLCACSAKTAPAQEQEPEQTAMLSSCDTPEAAAEEAKRLGAARLILMDSDGEREAAL